MSINRKRGSIALARQLCYQINGAADDSDDISAGGGYGSVDIAEILSGEVVRLREALAQLEQKPMLLLQSHRDGYWCVDLTCSNCYSSDFRFKHTTPPQRTFVGLTEQEHTDIAVECGCLSADWVFYGATVERKLKEKNTCYSAHG